MARAGQPSIGLPVRSVVEVQCLARIDGLAADAADADTVTLELCNGSGSGLAVFGSVATLLR
jgi:hypothetical protein